MALLRLPPELLEQIFDLVVADDWTTAYALKMMLSRRLVCRDFDRYLLQRASRPVSLDQVVGALIAWNAKPEVLARLLQSGCRDYERYRNYTKTWIAEAARFVANLEGLSETSKDWAVRLETLVDEACRILVDVSPRLDTVKRIWNPFTASQMAAMLEEECDIRQAALVFAAGANQVSLVQRLLAEGADPNQSPWEFSRPLHVAVHMGHREVVQVLLHAGADIDLREDCNSTPLFLGIEKSRADIVELLLENGASMTDNRRAYRTALHTAVAGQRDDFEIMQKLLDHGAELEEQHAGGMTVLQHAAFIGASPSLLAWLIHNGADVNSTGTSLDFPPLLLAIYEHHSEAAEVLLQAGAEVNFIQSESAAHIASRRGDTATLKMLKQYGADFNLETKGGITLLHAAVMGLVLENIIPTVSFLLECGVEVNCRERLRGRSPLSFCLGSEKRKIFDFLLDHGADPNLRENGMSTLLHRVVRKSACRKASKRHGNTVFALLQRGADAHACTLAGNQPIHVACATCSLVNVIHLLEHGADPDAQNRSGETPLKVTPKSFAPTIARVLSQYRTSPDDEDDALQIGIDEEMDELQAENEPRSDDGLANENELDEPEGQEGLEEEEVDMDIEGFRSTGSYYSGEGSPPVEHDDEDEEKSEMDVDSYIDEDFDSTQALPNPFLPSPTRGDSSVNVSRSMDSRSPSPGSLSPLEFSSPPRESTPGSPASGRGAVYHTMADVPPPVNATDYVSLTQHQQTHHSAVPDDDLEMSYALRAAYQDRRSHPYKMFAVVEGLENRDTMAWIPLRRGRYQAKKGG